jgi:hypothetical protein
MTTLKAAQEAAVEARVAEIQAGLQRQKEDLQREKDSAVLAEKAKVLKLHSELADMQRKLEGKSANELGEGSEIDLFEALRSAFDGDRIQRVPKGVNGADVIHEVVHNGRVCGKIIYDAKNRDGWQNGYCTKLRADKLAQAGGPCHPLQQQVPEGQEPGPRTGRRDRRQSRARAGDCRDPARPDRAHARAAHQQGGARGEDGRALRFVTSDHFKQLVEQVEAQAVKMLDLDSKEQEAHRRVWDQRGKLIRSVQKARSDLTFEIDRIIGTAGNGPEEAA